MAGEQTIVQAIFSFKGSNNDELCFKKGDIITVTQKDDEWWEGTFDGKTGWFPCNYVKECKDIPKPTVQQDNQNKSFVLKNLIDSEKNHVQELEGLVTNYLQPLEKSNLLSQDEFKQLTGNLNEVLETHQQLLNLVEQEYGKCGPDQRVGKLFLNLAPKIKGVLQLYCSLHPRAVLILDKFREELTKFMELRGAVGPGIIVLTTLLSKPFRRLEKYSGLLQELERHIEECHPDRGDTQRSVSIYKDIATTCLATRRQKELELQVLTGPVRGWDGPNLTTLGEIIYMGSVAVGMQHHDRYFVLFPNNLIILSVSHRLSAFIYEAKLFLAGLNVARLEDTETVKNAFEISAPMIDTKIVICQSKKEADHWVELLTNNPGLRNSTTTSHNNKILPSQAQYVPQPPPHHHTSPLIPPAPSPINNSLITSYRGSLRGGLSSFSSSSSAAPPPSTPPAPSAPVVAPHGIKFRQNSWSVTNLRPSPPLRPCLAFGLTPAGTYQRYNTKRPTTYKEDGQILDVIEAYCSLGKPRSTVNSVEILTGGNVQLPNKLMAMHQHQHHSDAHHHHHHRSTLELVVQPSQPRRFRPHGPPRASTWCCGSFVAKQLKRTQHLE